MSDIGGERSPTKPFLTVPYGRATAPEEVSNAGGCAPGRLRCLYSEVGFRTTFELGDKRCCINGKPCLTWYSGEMMIGRMNDRQRFAYENPLTSSYPWALKREHHSIIPLSG